VSYFCLSLWLTLFKKANQKLGFLEKSQQKSLWLTLFKKANQKLGFLEKKPYGFTYNPLMVSPITPLWFHL
jgi:hypothetical protein